MPDSNEICGNDVPRRANRPEKPSSPVPVGQWAGQESERREDAPELRKLRQPRRPNRRRGRKEHSSQRRRVVAGLVSPP